MLDQYETFKTNFYLYTKIDLNSYKENQMKRRIDAFITKYEYDTYNEFLNRIRSDSVMLDKFTKYLTINVSEFFRNPKQWQVLEDEVLPELFHKFGKSLKIWSAACSTGDEPYSLAMLLSKYVPLSQIKILATDLDTDVIARAKEGIYTEKSVRELPEDMCRKYFRQNEKGDYIISEEIKKCVTFKQHNLLLDSYEHGFDLIICRNVLIYFTEEAKEEIYQKFADSLTNDGILFVGSTEQILGYDKYGFSPIRSFFYQKKPCR